MHYTLTVALSGDVAPTDLKSALENLMNRFDEQREVAWHRDTSPYAEPFEAQYAKAVAFAIKTGRDWTSMSREAVVEDWDGDSRFDADGWPLTTENPDGHWDYWSVGGRWGGAWTLKKGAENGPLATEDHAFGRSPDADTDGQTDNARLRDIEPESITPTYSYLDLGGEWHTRWIGPTPEQATADGPPDFSNWKVPREDAEARFLKFVQDLPADTWLVQIDYHS